MLLKDLAFAWRTLHRNRLFTTVAMLTIALGIGASTAIFSVVNAVLLQPLPYAAPDRLVLVWGDLRARDVTDWPFSAPDFNDLRQQGTMFEDLAAVQTVRMPYVAEGDDEPVLMSVALVTANTFRVLGLRVAAGRDFTDADDVPPSPPSAPAPGQPNQPAPPPQLIAIMGYEFWQSRFGGDPGIVGRTLEITGARVEIIGISAPRAELLLPPTTKVDRAPDFWVPARLDYVRASRIQHSLRVIGRLKPGVTVGQAQAQVDTLAAKLREEFPIKKTSGLYFRVEPMSADLVEAVRPSLLALLGAVGSVLLIACANVANLLLVRLAERERELAVRTALGGRRSRLVRQLLAESLLIAGGGAVGGLVLAIYGIDPLLAMAPLDLPRIDTVTIDLQVLAFAAAATVLAALVFGLVPAMRASRPDVIEILRTGGRGGGMGGRRIRNAVVTVEVALAFVLLVGSGLMLRSFVALHRIDFGFDPHGLLVFNVQRMPGRTAEEIATIVKRLQKSLAAVPGVEAVTAAGPMPLDGESSLARWGPEEALADPTRFQQGIVHTVLPGFFEVMRGRLLAGRTFTEADNVPGLNVVIIDDLVAARAFPGGQAVGKRLLVRIQTPEAEWMEVIGVVAHQRHLSLARAGEEALFVTEGYRNFGRALRWAVRTSLDAASLGPDIRSAVAQVDTRLVVTEMQPMQAYVDRLEAPTRFAFTLIAAFAGMAVLLSAIGLYGVLATAVRQRTSEIGVRMAFGAPRESIFRLIVGEGLVLGASGVALGLAAALVATKVMTSLLVGVTPTDPPTYAAIAVLFLVISTVATWLPARHAADLDPNEALRNE